MHFWTYIYWSRVGTALHIPSEFKSKIKNNYCFSWLPPKIHRPHCVAKAMTENVCDKLILRSDRLISFHFTTLLLRMVLAFFYSVCPFHSVVQTTWALWTMKMTVATFECFMWNAPFNKILSLILFVFLSEEKNTSDHPGYVVLVRCLTVFHLHFLSLYKMHLRSGKDSFSPHTLQCCKCKKFFFRWAWTGKGE